MNKEELSKELNISITEIEKNFTRLQNRFAKNGIQIIKVGRGKSADYILRKENPITIYNLDKTLYLSDELISLPDFSLLTAIAMTVEDKTFNHRTYQDFLKFLEIEPNTKNINLLKAALSYLDSQEIIVYKEDKSRKDYFVATWSIKSKEEYSTELKLLSHCRNIANKAKKSDKYIIYLLKTWIGIGITNGNTITKKDFCQRFNISTYQFDECKKILEKENLIKYNPEKIKVGDINYTIGTNYHHNIISNLPVFHKEKN